MAAARERGWAGAGLFDGLGAALEVGGSSDDDEDEGEDSDDAGMLISVDGTTDSDDDTALEEMFAGSGQPSVSEDDSDDSDDSEVERDIAKVQ